MLHALSSQCAELLECFDIKSFAHLHITGIFGALSGFPAGALKQSFDFIYVIYSIELMKT